MNADVKRRELESLRAKARQLESELAEEQLGRPWQAREYYTAYYANSGFMLGMFAAAASLIFNIIGSLLVGQHPLELIRVYLTFPMGAEALDYDAVNNGLALAIGCCLYLGTGALLGVPFYLVLTRFTADGTWTRRLVVVSALAIGVWLVNFYGILSWLQPLLFGGNWIVERVPWWVGALTHLVFGWTMVLLYPLGLYSPYRSPTEPT